MRQKDFRDIGTRWRWLFWETLTIVLGVLISFDNKEELTLSLSL